MFALGPAVFIASLLGSLHCVGMCGPFALMAGTSSAGNAEGKHPRWFAVAGYNLGRLATYLLIGLAAGSLGLALDIGGQVAGWQQTATYAAGSLMVATAFISLARHFGWLRGSTWAPSGLVLGLQWALRRGRQLPPFQRSMAVGFVTTWMPCGWLYVFALAAAGTANPLWGAFVMLLFWGGTLPVLTVLVWGGAWLVKRPNWNVQPAVAAMVLLIGIGTILFRAPIQLENTAVAAPTSLVETLEHVQQIDEVPLPCCCEKQ
ncbi:MAG: sulfite exporter TauE/SafE family protein [Planctomycetota bacterium]|jgi:sulfite exporter TauE/SafE|nr:sulfite exporter TauE/SafE family protein [Blastopirellula sp.]